MLIVVGCACVVIAVAMAFRSFDARIPSRRTRNVLMVVFMTLGAYLTEYTPYIATAGLAALLSSAFRGMSPEHASNLRKVGIMAIVGGICAIGLNLIESPWSGDANIEDRIDWHPPAPVHLTPAQVLGLPWSTNDEHC